MHLEKSWIPLGLPDRLKLLAIGTGQAKDLAHQKNLKAEI